MFSSMLSLLGSLRGGSSFITNSLRFRSSASAFLSRTPISNSTSDTIRTFSAWVKRGAMPAGRVSLFYQGASSGAGQMFNIEFNNDTLRVFYDGGITYSANTSAVFRDSSAWYHVLVASNTTIADPNKTLIYINGSLQTITGTPPPPNYTAVTGTTSIHRIAFTAAYFDGYLTEVHFIDGQALTPASFGAIDSSTGVWAPRPYSGTYGTNGFYLKFANTSSVAALGNDSSGNNNTWTVNNVSLTAGATYDSMIDVPVNYSDGGNGRGNYAVLNPLDQVGITCSGGNLNYSSGSSGDFAVRGTMFNASGKWYFEWEQSTTPVGGQIVGVANASQVLNQTNQHTTSTNLWCLDAGNGQKCNGGQSAYGTAVAANVVIGVAVDMDAGKIYFRNASGYFSSGDPVAGTNAAFTNLTGQSVAPYYYDGASVSSPTGSFNFGQRPFTYTPPAGFRALNTQNLPTPSIVNGANFMAATTYTGNAAARSLSNAVNSVSFQPDLVWIKNRTAGTFHALFDSARGATRYLSSNTTALEALNANTLTAFTADGFSLGNDTTLVNSGTGGANSYVAWQWKAGGAAVSNTQGTITSQVSANTTAGFSVVTYTGTGVNATVGHGLGVAPKMVIVKNRNSALPTSWPVWHTTFAGTEYVQLDGTNAKTTGATIWNSAVPNSTVFSIGTAVAVNESTKNFVAYCFAEIAGFSRFGSYTGNGSADGPFVFCGFRPRFVMVKAAVGGTGNWTMLDTSRDVFNLMDNPLFADLPGTETPDAVNYNLDGLSNGFKLRTNGTGVNASGVTYIFAAFAENPSKYALAR